MSGPERIQLRRTKGWRKPENTVVVARPHVLGNPFKVHHVKCDVDPWQVIYEPDLRVDRRSPHRLLAAECASRIEAMRLAVDLYRDWATSGPNHYHRVQYFIDTHQLGGKNLACWCPLDQPCHADEMCIRDRQGDQYLDGARVLLGADDAAFVFVVQEKTAPYLVNVVELNHELRKMGRERNERAVHVYQRCMETGDWPGYPEVVHKAIAPTWATYQHEEDLSTWEAEQGNAA